MPIYEYRCHNCRRRVSHFYRSFADIPEVPTCPRCGSTDLTRLMSRVAVVRSEESRIDDLADPTALGDLDEEDPKSIARWMRRMSAETGEEMPQEFDEVMDRLEAGQKPEEIEEAMPGLSEGMGGGVDDDLM